MSAITSADGFHHLVYSISGTTHTLFLDGSAVSVNTNGTNIFSTFPNISNMFIGTAGDLSYGYTGYIDEFKVFNRALTITDVSSIYNTLKTPIKTALNITSNRTIPFSTNGLPLTANATYYNISATDYGDIVIATSIGIYYSSNCGNTFTRSNITTSCTSISMNNAGKALASNANTIYYSSDYGITWSVANSTISTNIKQVVVTQTGLSYILTTTTYIYSSTDYFKTNNTLINSTRFGGLYYMNFASNGNGAICGNAFTMYYSASSNTWISGNIGNGLGAGISDNGNYIAGLSIDAALLLANLAPSNAIDISKFVSYNARSITMNNGGLVSIGNDGTTYFGGNNGPTYSGTLVIFKLKNGTFTNTSYIPVNYNFIPVTPSGNFVVTISSNNLIILSP